MPIALLPELAAAFERAGRVLAPWSRLASLEEQILRRARSAFLVYWFGTGVPTLGIDLHVAIRNIDALKRRYLEVRRSMEGPGPELSLLGPVSGIAGMLVGLAMSPTGAILIAIYARRISELIFGSPWNAIMPWLYWFLGTWLLPTLGPVLGMPLLLIGMIGLVAGGNRDARNVYMLLGEVAMLIDAIVRFWDVVSGPRTNVRNPVLRRILGVLDRFAGLVAQIMGFAALLVTRVVRLLPSLMDQFRAFGGLADAVMAALVDILQGMVERVVEPFGRGPGLMPILERVFESFLALPAVMLEAVNALVTNSIATIIAAFATISSRIDTFVTGLRGRIVDLFRQSVVGVLLGRIEALLAMMPAIKQAYADAEARRKPEPQPSAPGQTARTWGFILTGGLWGSLGTWMQSSLGSLFESFGDIRRNRPPFPHVTVPDFPPIPALPSLDAIMTRIGRPSGLDSAALTARLDAEAAAALARRRMPPGILQDPASLFAREREALDAAGGRPPLRLEDERLRDLIYIAVGRVLPPSLRVHAPSVREFFDWLDEHIHGIERDPVELPMLDLADTGRLRPVVKMLTVRSRGGFAPDLRAFRDLLLEELRSRTYLAPQVV